MNYGKITAKVSDRTQTSSFELADGSVLRVRCLLCVAIPPRTMMCPSANVSSART